MTLNKYVFVWLGIVLATVSTAEASWKEKCSTASKAARTGRPPQAASYFDAAGNLYGATTNGGGLNCRGPFQCGTVYQLAPPAKQGDPWTETLLHVFKGSDGNDGASPFGGLIIDAAGNLYGTTGYDGSGNCMLFGSRVGCGIVYELSPPAQKGGDWTETVLYNFRSGAGFLYGTTRSLSGGSDEIVFKIIP
jgi:hypothetical protein